MKFIPKGPKRYAHQRRILRRIIETKGVCALLCEPGTGKQQPVTAPVLTPTGWKAIGDLRPGDALVSPSGERSEVLSVHPQSERRVYRLRFSDGSEALAGPEHLWAARTHNDANRDAGWRIVTTQELSDTLDRRWEIPQTLPIDFAPEQLPADPYLVGVYLGDGTSDSGRRKLCTDREIIEALDLGTVIKPHKTSPFTAYAVIPKHRFGGLDIPGRSWEKSVPEPYMRGAASDRLALLQGLLDTDGSPMHSGGVEFSTTSLQLAEQVREITHSLGGVAGTLKPRRTLYAYKGEKRAGRTSYRVNVRLPEGMEPFRLTRKLERWARPTSRFPKRVLRSVEFSHYEDSVCIRVSDPAQLYLTNDYIVTHNTAPTLDYLSILALKSQEYVGQDAEVRALVISPKAAVDNWVLQAEKYVHDDVNVWAEALGGSIFQKTETLRSRGPEMYRPKAVRRAKDLQQIKHRGLNADRAELIYARGSKITPAQGPADLVGKPRLVLLSMNYDAFASRDTRGSRTMADEMMDAVRKFRPDVIICDEMHKIKGHGSNTSRLVGRIGALSPRRLGLTGTVMPHSPMDVFAQWRFIQPTAFGDYDPKTGGRKRATIGVFQRRFGVMGGFMGREVVAFRNLDEMQAIMAENSIVVKKEDALDLPETQDVEVIFPLEPREQRAYDEMKQNLATQLDSGVVTSQNRLTQMLRLRQITAGHLPDDQGEVQTVGDSKVRTIASIAHDTLEGEKRIVVFGVFRHEMAALHDALSKKGTEVLVIDGRTPDDERLAIRQRFGSDDPARIILLAQIKTISLSVNELVTASNAIFASLSQQRDDLIQGRDRLNRIGQVRKMTFWFPLARGTVDEVIYRSHQARTDLEAAVLKHVQGLLDMPHAEMVEE